jgi:phthalate 4,5-dioxygenase
VMTDAENDAMTSIGPGTWMGNLMRQYWIPALRVDELPSNDCDPVRVMLLGERLIAFRDSAGEIGLLAERCPHRGASLFFGRNEDGGLRCAYHGWKFDVRGQCLETPCEPATSRLWQRIRAQAYPCRTRGGIVWTYMGPRKVPPPLPELIVNMELTGAERVDLMQVDSNWLQNLEGDVDTDHITVLHGANLNAFKATLRGAGSAAERAANPTLQSASSRSFERLPLEVMDSAVGCTFASHVTAGVRRHAPGDLPLPDLWAVGQFMMPFYSMLPYGSLAAHWVAARVPMDDHHTMTFGMYARNSPIPSEELMFGPAPARLSNGNDWFDRFRLRANSGNDFALDRTLARSARGAFAVGAGVPGQAVQDYSITRSMGTVADRSKEHLCPGDAAIVQVRKRLMNAARALSEKGTIPPGVDFPAGYRMQQGLLRAGPGRSWRDEVELRRESTSSGESQG